MGAPRRDSYIMEIDRGRNCYTCGRFGYIAQHCRNKRQRDKMVEGRRVEYRQWEKEKNIEYSNNLKEEENLEFLD